MAVGISGQAEHGTKVHFPGVNGTSRRNSRLVMLPFCIQGFPALLVEILTYHYHYRTRRMLCAFITRLKSGNTNGSNEWKGGK